MDMIIQIILQAGRTGVDLARYVAPSFSRNFSHDFGNDAGECVVSLGGIWLGCWCIVAHFGYGWLVGGGGNVPLFHP